ncbi:MAG: lysophospholipid acyltransferase family protein [Verrucomicrobiales bacterium]|nr:lysophospholipid acyltransferase family protein [Verrucomicrobiales bacterium]
MKRGRASTLYRGGLWRVGLGAARRLPRGLSCALGSLGAAAYGALAVPRRRILESNLAPIVGDGAAATATAGRLLREFAIKLVDLWRFEAGVSMHPSFVTGQDWRHLTDALAKRRGVLLVTPHLGNWELGAPLLASRGIRLAVVTQAEPGDDFTELRRQARSRQGIETVVIGQDAFGSIPLIRKLEEGVAVAMLIDRPASNATTVELFGRPFAASLAPADLARVTGCAIVGVYIVRTHEGYCAHALPEFHYDRAQLGTRESRRQFVQDIVRAFEPVIRQHATQWFHFVPVWTSLPPMAPEAPGQPSAPPRPIP